MDRRLRLEESIGEVKKEIDQLIVGKDAEWELGTLVHTSWTGETSIYQPAHDPWKLDEKAILAQASINAYRDTIGTFPTKYDFWDFGTNAVDPVSMGMQTIGFGPGEYKLAHMRNERWDPWQVIESFEFYTNLIKEL